MTRELILATKNQGKVREFKRMLNEYVDDIHVLSLIDLDSAPDIDETGSTLEENARLKVTAITRLTGKAALGDDSGIFVDALGGAPGIFSARYAGEHGDDQANNAKLLRELHALELEGPISRSAAFRCAVALTFPNHHARAGEVIIERGEMRGEIVDTPRGEHGFGYDPLFVPLGYDLTSAELTAAEKDRISHRGAALRAILPILISEL